MLNAETLASAEEGHGAQLQPNGHGLGHGHGHGHGVPHGRDRREKLSDVNEEDGRMARKYAAQQQVNGQGGAGGDEWEQLVMQAKQAGRAWWKAWEKDGVNGCVVLTLRARNLLSSAQRARTPLG